MKRFSLSFPGGGSVHAFTLIEVVIALGITTFCIITLLALLPVGVNTAVKSRGETRASYLAEQIISDLRSSPFNSATILSSSGGSLAPLTPFSMATASTNVLACDAANNVLAMVPASQYAAAFAGTGTNYLVQVVVSPSALPNLSTVSVEVSAPAQAALASRSRYSFQTMIGNRQ